MTKVTNEPTELQGAVLLDDSLIQSLHAFDQEVLNNKPPGFVAIVPTRDGSVKLFANGTLRDMFGMLAMATAIIGNSLKNNASPDPK